MLRRLSGTGWRLLAALLLLSPVLLPAAARADEPIVIPSVRPAEGGVTPFQPAAPAAASLTAAPAAARSSETVPSVWHQHFDTRFRKNWGIEVLGIHPVSSGWMLEFKYRVVDADKAAILNEKRSKAFVIDEATDVRLAVPAMENIGELRQTPRPEEGRVYYVMFGNPGRLVKRGGRVDVVVGSFRADGLVVE